MRKILIFFMVFSLHAYAETSVEISALINGETKNIAIDSGVYGDVTGVLSTCDQYGKFISVKGDLEASYIDYDFVGTLAELKKIKLKDHIKISYKNGSVRLPTRTGSVFVDEIYVWFTKHGYPVIYTYGDGIPYSYSRCSGHLLTGHFRCNAVINEMFKIEQKNSFCENH